LQPRSVPVVKEFLLVVLVWVQLSPPFNVIVFTSLVRPVLARVAQVVPAPAQVESNVSAGV
jgi:hypothetical protein